eukprot:4279622-Pyramimonas_sp.AAC.1
MELFSLVEGEHAALGVCLSADSQRQGSQLEVSEHIEQNEELSLLFIAPLTRGQHQASQSNSKLTPDS